MTTYNDENSKAWRRKHNKRSRKSFDIIKTKKESIDTTIEDIINLFRLKKENKWIKDGITRDIRNVFRVEKNKVLKYL